MIRPAIASVVVALVALTCATVADATVRYAAPDGDGPPGSCPNADPCGIDDAVESPQVTDRDFVVLLPGTYVQADELTIERGIVVHGELGSATPVIETGTAGGVRLDAAEGALRDVTIRQPATASGSAALLVLDGVADRVRVRSAGSIACEVGSPDGLPLLRDSICWSDAPTDGGIAVANRGSGAATSVARIRNVTAYGSGPLSVGIQAEAASTSAKNVIAVGASDDVSAVAEAGSSASVDLDNSNFSSVAESGSGASITGPGTGENQVPEPRLVDPLAGRFDQRSGSPTIDAGRLDPLLGDFDVYGDPRIQDGAPDIGADEYPDIRVTGIVTRAKRRQVVRHGKVRIRLRAGADETVGVTARGRIRVGHRRYALGPVSTQALFGRKADLELGARRSVDHKVVVALRHGKKVVAGLSVELADTVGNRSIKHLRVRLRAG